MSRSCVLVLTLLLLPSAAIADDFAGQASVIDGDTLEIHGTRIRLWGIDARRRAASSAVAKTACNIAAARRRRSTWTPLLPGARSTVHRSASIHMAARWRPVRSVVPISGNGLCAMALHWIGPGIRKADTTALSTTPSAPAEVSGRGAMWSLGSIAPASARMESRPPALTTPTRIPD